MTELEIPDIGALLAGVLASLPEAAHIGLIAGLERTAAERYREWAASETALAPELLACAAREEEIAARAERLSPVPSEHAAAVDEALARAREVYAGLFVGRPVRDRIVIQAHAERQGARAWRSFARRAGDSAARAGAPAAREELLALAELELASAEAVDRLLGIRSTDRV